MPAGEQTKGKATLGHMTTKASKDRNFFRKIARRENPIWFTVPLPADIDLEQIAWKPTREELLFAWLENEKQKAAEEELAYYRRRAAEIAAQVEQDRIWLEQQREREARLAAIQNHYLSEREKEAQAGDKSRREKCARIGTELNRAAARDEREELIRRGMYRGRPWANRI
jgi:hypothetical protein